MKWDAKKSRERRVSGESSRHVSGGEISRQTVMKKVRQLNGLEMACPEEKRRVQVLHVEADEDHVAMQMGLMQ